MKLTYRENLIQAREAYGKAFRIQQKQILVCAGTGCVAGGSVAIYQDSSGKRNFLLCAAYKRSSRTFCGSKEKRVPRLL